MQKRRDLAVIGRKPDVTRTSHFGSDCPLFDVCCHAAIRPQLEAEGELQVEGPNSAYAHVCGLQRACRDAATR